MINKLKRFSKKIIPIRCIGCVKRQMSWWKILEEIKYINFIKMKLIYKIMNKTIVILWIKIAFYIIKVTVNNNTQIFIGLKDRPKNIKISKLRIYGMMKVQIANITFSRMTTIILPILLKIRILIIIAIVVVSIN